MSNWDAFCSSPPSRFHSSRSISCAPTPTGNICDSPARIQPVATINTEGNWRGVGVGDNSQGRNGNRVTTEISNDDTDSTRSVSGRGHHVGLVSSGDGEGGEQLPELELNSVQNRRPGERFRRIDVALASAIRLLDLDYHLRCVRIYGAQAKGRRHCGRG